MFLGLDLASRLSGWCCGSGEEIPICGAHPLPGTSDVGQLQVELCDLLNVLHRRFSFTHIAFEAPILVANRDTVQKLRALYGLGSFTEFWAKKRGIPCVDKSVQQIKRELTGNAIAEKDDMVAVARKVGLDLPAGEKAKDAADAFGVWLLVLRDHNRSLSAEWDRRVWTPRGALL